MYDDSQIINGCRPMTAGDGRGRKFTVNGRPIRPSPSGLKKDGAVPSWLRTDGKPPSRPVLSDVGRTGRLTTLLAIWDQRGVFRRACQKAMRSGNSSSAGES